MGSRSNYRTVAAILQAFAFQSTWRQTELAERVGVQTRAARRVLVELSEAGMPLTSEREHPHVYWSVPAGWFPGGVVFSQSDWFVLVDAVAHVPNAERRRALLERLVAGNESKHDAIERLGAAITATTLSSEQHAHYLTLQRAIIDRSAVEMKYYTSTTGGLSWRFATPQRLIDQPKARFIAFCHRRKALRWFRLSNIQKVQLAPTEPYHECSADLVDEFIKTSVDGFRDGTEEPLVFSVRTPEATWVRDNLLPGMTVDSTETHDRLVIRATGAALVVARFVVGLGGAARAETPELRAVVRELAELASKANE